MHDTTVLRTTIGRAVLLAVLVCDLVATGWFGTGERVTMLARSLAFPGIGFVEWQPLLASLTIMVAIAATVGWLRWGADWVLATVWISAAAVTWFVVPLHHDESASSVPAALRVLGASHEFAVVLVVMAVVGRARVAWASSWPGASARSARRSGVGSRAGATPRPAAIDRARAAAIATLAGDDGRAPVEALSAPDVVRRAVRIGRLARLRFDGEPWRADQAAARAGLAMAGASTPAQLAAFRAEGRRRRTGVPGSEPTWVRPLDGTLAALALDRLGEQDCVERWRRTFERQFGLRHGRRRGALHTPSMLTIGTATAWEHAAATALARRAGWIGDEDWVHLRRRCLGAAARGARSAEDARLVAAGRVWAGLVDDADASRILRRPTLLDDVVAQALDRLQLAPDPPR